MSGTLAIKDTNGLTDIRWAPMVTLSFLLHLVIFLILLYVTGSTPSWRNTEGVIYEVNLIEMPESVLNDKTSGGSDKKITDSSLKKETQAKRITIPGQKKKSLPIAKRTVNKKKTSPEKPEISSSQLIDRVISRLEKKVKSDNKNDNYLEETISKIESRIGPSDSDSGNNGAPSNNISFRIYRMKVYSWVKNQWAYPEALSSQKKLEAVVSMKIKQDGTIIEEPWLKSSSGNHLFDQSVMKAIEKAIPLPKFPEGYRKSYYEFEFIFRLKDLEE
jgi:TonB family protein